MAQQNLISVEIPADVLQSVNDGLAKIMSDLEPFLVSLTADQKMGMVKMGDGTVAFVNKALSYIDTNPEFIPPFLSAAEMKIDGVAVAQLAPVVKQIAQLAANLEDTLMLCGSEAYLASLIYYNSVKLAAKSNIPDALVIFEDMSQRFPGGSRNRTSKTTPAP